jgi:hypothetical protein
VSNPTSGAKPAALPDEVFSAVGVPPKARKRAADALLRLVDERVRVALQAATEGRGFVRGGGYPEGSLGGGIDRAEQEGQRLKQEIMRRPGMLTPEDAAARAGISRQALDLRRRRNQALALSHVKRGYRYPAWQFDDNVAPSLTPVLAALSYLDAWGQYFFLTQPEPLLEGKTPLSAIRAGKLERVLWVVERLHAGEGA